MRQGNQLGGALGRLDCGDACHAQHVTLPGLAGANHRQCLGPHDDAAPRPRDPPRDLLTRHVDHARLTGGVEVGKMCPLSSHRARPPLSIRSPTRPELSPRQDNHSTLTATPPAVRRRFRSTMVAWIGASLALMPVAGAQNTAQDLPVFGRSQAVPNPPPPALQNLPQGLPDLGDPSAALLSGVQERKLGESVMREVRGSGGYLNDPEVVGYLNELGNRLVNAVPGAPVDFEFFAMAGALAAAVLVSRSHSSSSGDMTQAAIASASGLAIQSQISFTRQNEEEADRIGFQRMVAAGFDPTSMATFMERLQRSTRFVEGNAPNYLRDHPVTTQRIADAQARAQGLPFRQVPDSLDFQMVRALLRSYEGTPREAVAFFRDAIAERKYNNEVAAHYGLVAALLRAQDLKTAQAELTALEKTAPPHPMIEGIAGQVLMQSGQLKAAITRYQAALVRYPRKMQLVYDYPEALMKDNQASKAATFLTEQLQRFPSDGPLHQLAARAYAALGKQLLQHQHQAEFYAWQGNLKAAVMQLELAIKAGDGDFYQLSAAESRLRAVRQELVDQEKDSGSNRCAG